MAVCAEAVALGRAVTEAGETGIETIAAVRHPDPRGAGSGHRRGLPARKLAASRYGITIAMPGSSCPVPTARHCPDRRVCCRTNTTASAPCEDASLSPTPAAWLLPNAATTNAAETRCVRSAGRVHRPAAGALPFWRCPSRRRARASEALDHVLFVGPPGLGKTTLAQIVTRELGVNFRATSGPAIAKAGDLAALLTNLEERDVLFIDEIHRLTGGRGIPLSRDGGFPARPHHRRGTGGVPVKIDPARSR